MYNNNNYGYNPYYQQQRFGSIPQQPIQQPAEQMQSVAFNGVQSRSTLNGKQVDSVDVVKATDIPLDGSVSYFPLVDGTAIVTKQLQMDGTSKMVVYKPVNEEKTTAKYITEEDLKKSLNDIDFSEIDDLKEELRELKKELKDMQKKLKSKGE